MASSLPQKLPLELMQTRWASLINPLLSNPMSEGVFLKNILLSAGANTINHLLQRQIQGWQLIDVNSATTIYRSQPLNGLTLTLTSSAPCTVSLYVF